MIAIPRNYYSNLSCYEDFVIRTNLLGYDVSDAIDLLCDYPCIFRVTHSNINDCIIYFSVGDSSNRHICIIDKYGNKMENCDAIEGDFGCHNMHLTSLKGAPKKVGCNFSCSYNDMTSLIGCPAEIGGHFTCFGCFNLRSLDGAPYKVGGGVDLSECKQLSFRQRVAYNDWLETNPTEVYHDPFVNSL